MSDEVQGVFEAVRESASRAAWSKGVELVRAGSVVGDQEADGQVVLKVATPGALISRTVTLYLADEDWSCDCGGQADACEHAAAAVIALKQARLKGEALPQPGGGKARLRYLFKREQGALLFERAFVIGGEEQIFDLSLAGIAAGRVKGPAFVATSADMQVELVLGMRSAGWMPREVMANLLEALVDCGDVRLDGQPVQVSKEQVSPLAARLEEQGAGYRLSVSQNPEIEESFSNGVARIGTTLRPVGEVKLTAREMQELGGAGKVFGPGQLVELMTEVLPSLRERLPVDVRAKRLPRTAERAAPRIVVETSRAGDALTVLATMVYGDPPIARVDAGRLVSLGQAIPIRDELAEERLLRQLGSQLGLAPGRRESFVGEEGVAFARKLAGFKGTVQGDAQREFFLAAPLVAHLALQPDRSDFTLVFESELAGQEAGGPAGEGASKDQQGTRGSLPGAERSAATGRVGEGNARRRADPAAVVRAWRSGGNLAPLIDGGWAPLPRDWLAKYGDRVADLLAAKEARGELPASALPDLARLCEALGEPPPPAFKELEPLLADFTRLPAAAAPADLAVELRHYQQTGLDWLSFLKRARLGALLADDMGLGKTLQALCAIDGPALVVAPTSVVHNWEAEAARFRPGLRVSVYHGPQRKLDPSADLTLTSYAILRLDADALIGVDWGTVVLDEAQTIKNPDSQVARAAYRLRARWRVALTGTPVENRLDELWSQFHFLNPGLLGGRQDFEERYARPIAEGQPGAAARLRERIRPFLLRRLKREVAPELPPRTEVVLRFDLADEERAVYEAVRAATREDVLRRLREGGNVLAALEALLRLRQACCHPALVPGQEARSSSKVELLLEQLQEAVADGHKSLVFSQWTSLLDLIEPHLKEAGLAFTRLDGATRDRAAVVESFQRDDGPPLMLVSLKAGGAGLNLTAADHVFLVDPWWNPAVEDQAADRAHRIGQTRPVLIHRLVALGTVEERILALQQDKRAIAEAALSGAERAASLTRDDLIALLG